MHVYFAVLMLYKRHKYFTHLTGGELKSGRSQIEIWGKLVLGSQNNTPHETNGINNAVSCYKEAVQFSAFFVTLCLPVFDEICGTTRDFIFL